MKHTTLTRLTTGALAAALVVSLVGCGTGNQPPSVSSAPAAGVHHRHHRPQDPDPDCTTQTPSAIFFRPARWS